MDRQELLNFANALSNAKASDVLAIRDQGLDMLRASPSFGGVGVLDHAAVMRSALEPAPAAPAPRKLPRLAKAADDDLGGAKGAAIEAEHEAACVAAEQAIAKAGKVAIGAIMTAAGAVAAGSGNAEIALPLLKGAADTIKTALSG